MLRLLLAPLLLLLLLFLSAGGCPVWNDADPTPTALEFGKRSNFKNAAHPKDKKPHWKRTSNSCDSIKTKVSKVSTPVSVVNEHIVNIT